MLRVPLVASTGRPGYWLELLVVLVVVAVAIVPFAVVLHASRFGRKIFAIGGNTEAARLAGIDTRLNSALLYVLSGTCCGIAAVMLLARTTTGSSTHGSLYELDAIAAVVLGALNGRRRLA